MVFWRHAISHHYNIHCVKLLYIETWGKKIVDFTLHSGTEQSFVQRYHRFAYLSPLLPRESLILHCIRHLRLHGCFLQDQELEVSILHVTENLSISQDESQGHAAFGRIRSWINSPGSNWFSGWLLQAQLPKVPRADTQQQFCRSARESSLQGAKHGEMFCFLPISRKLPPLVWTTSRSDWITAGTPRDCLSFLSHPFC